jgi:hypothetical protein
MGTNLLSIIQKYTLAGSFLRELTEIIKKVNGKGNVHKEEHVEVTRQPKKQFLSPDPKHYDKQTRVNAEHPSPSGVISSPDPKNQDSIQKSYKPPNTFEVKARKAAVINDSDSEGEVHSMDNDNSKAMREEPGNLLHNIRGVARQSGYRKAK